MLTAYSKREQPGFVVGLSRSHRPVRGAWNEDAAAWYERLSGHCDPPAEEESPVAPGDVPTVRGALVSVQESPEAR